MKLGDFLNSGFVVEGWKRLQTWVDDKPKLIAEGYHPSGLSAYLDWNVVYIFPCVRGEGEPGICIELMEGD